MSPEDHGVCLQLDEGLIIYAHGYITYNAYDFIMNDKCEFVNHSSNYDGWIALFF